MGSRVQSGCEKKRLNKGAAKVKTSHDRMRDQLAQDVEAFLAQGGEIQHLEPYVRSASNDADQDSF
jgi:hypothetical protein